MVILDVSNTTGQVVQISLRDGPLTVRKPLIDRSIEAVASESAWLLDGARSCKEFVDLKVILVELSKF